MNMLTLNALTNHPGPWGHGAGGWWFLFIPFFWIFWLFVFWFVFGRIARRRGVGPWRGGWTRSGESVLAERYARGEIDEEEFETRRQVLRRAVSP